MNWGRAGNATVVSACAMILFVHAPAIVVDPVTTAITQVRNGNVPTAPAATEDGSFTDLASKAVKKMLK